MSESISCACGKTTISVPCGRKRTSKPPQCTKPCSLPPVCHHSQAHHCHFGKCPPCKQVCSLPLPCDHLCLAPCHLQPVHQPQVHTVNNILQYVTDFFIRRNLLLLGKRWNQFLLSGHVLLADSWSQRLVMVDTKFKSCLVLRLWIIHVEENVVAG